MYRIREKALGAVIEIMSHHVKVIEKQRKFLHTKCVKERFCVYMLTKSLSKWQIMANAFISPGLGCN